jgi:A/G-specific adenine glycosylase
MLQQTRVEQVVPYYEAFMKAFPTVEALAAASEDAVMKLWEGLGYYARARNLHKTAKIIVQDLGGRFPRTAAKWQELPGVGRYSAAAIASIAFNERIPVLETNVKRVLARLFDISDCVDEPITEEALLNIVETLIPVRSPGDFNQAMMELGARICMPAEARCDGCPMRRLCSSYAAGTQKERPVTRPAAEPVQREGAVAVILKDENYLIGRRPSKGLLGGLWEFPSLILEADENPEQALTKFAKEELGLNIRVGELLTDVEHSYSHMDITLHVYRCRVVSGSPKPKTHSELRWVSRTDLYNFALPKANHKFLRFL